MTEIEIIGKFLDKRLMTNKATRKTYRINILGYFKRLGIKPEEIDGYFNNGRTIEQYESDLEKVYHILVDEGKPDLSIRVVFIAIKQFLTTQNKQLRDLDFWDTLQARSRGAEAYNDENILNRDDIKEILSHGNTFSRAFFLVLASSGRRIGEILALTPSDVDLSRSPATMNIRKTYGSNKTKTKQKTICFISDEAGNALREWMKERDDYLKESINRGSFGKLKDANDPRIFPMSYNNAIFIWRNLLMKANRVEIERYTNKWNGRTYKRVRRNHKYERTPDHPHCLRKFFITYLGEYSFADFLAGHSSGMVKIYNKMKPEDLAERYKKFMHNVTIFETTSEDIHSIREELDRVKLEKAEQDKEIQKLQLKLVQLLASSQIEKGVQETGKS